MYKFLFAFLFFAVSCTSQTPGGNNASLPHPIKPKPADTEVMPVDDYIKGKDYSMYSVATFAGGCFWCTEASFERIKGVVDVISGYSGGKEQYPTYQEVSSKMTSHAEAIQIYFDPNVITYEDLLKVFFVAHDPTQLNRQGPDVGKQYRSEIFYHNEAQKEAAEKVMKEEASHFNDPIVTKLEPYTQFWVAEGYHQDYYEHNPGNPYVQRVSMPKVKKVTEKFSDWVKEEYKGKP
ncbi:MAG: peptide-methionine (S)-S-oxide reductase MsrA [Saprospiraceae bacterium]|nr:peptide-methionine (S)-S-oxide reductase MsrA [Saprospiraceae bacterium]